MNADNPYESPQEETETAPPAASPLRKIGTTLLLIGLAILVYGATGFWLIHSLLPNGGGRGRLPSVYVMGIGIVVILVGLGVRDLRIGRKSKQANEEPQKGISTSYGILGLVVILLICFAIISFL